MNTIKLILTGLILCFPIHLTSAGRTPQALTRQAAALAESKNYAQAIQVYQDLLQEPLSSWQRAVIMYNIGCVLLAEEKWQEAIHTFNSVSLDNDLEPLLRYRVEYNVAVTYLRQAVSLIDSDPPHAIELLRKILTEIPEIQQAYCDLEHVIGNDQCPKSFELIQMHTATLQYLSKALQNQLRHTVAKSSLQKGFPILLNAVNDTLSNAEFLKKTTLESALRGRYRDLFVKEIPIEEQMWNALKEKLLAVASDNVQQKRLELFATAESSFYQGARYMENENYSESALLFEKTAAALKELIALPSPKEAPEKTPPAESKKPEIPKDTSKENMDAVLRTLLEMEHNDPLPKSKPSLQSQELRPW